MVLKALLIPASILGGLLAGFAGKRAYALLWKLVDEEEPPSPDQHPVGLGKLTLALALEGAVFRTARGVTDHVTRRGLMRATGTWPGDALVPSR